MAVSIASGCEATREMSMGVAVLASVVFMGVGESVVIAPCAACTAAEPGVGSHSGKRSAAALTYSCRMALENSTKAITSRPAASASTALIATCMCGAMGSAMRGSSSVVWLFWHSNWPSTQTVQSAGLETDTTNPACLGVEKSCVQCNRSTPLSTSSLI